MFVEPTVTVGGVEVVLDWDEAEGVSASLQSSTFTRDSLQEFNSEIFVLADKMRMYDAQCRFQQYDLTAHGMRHVHLDDLSVGPVRHFSDTAPFGSWIAVDPADITLGTPYVTPVIAPSDDLSDSSERAAFFLGNVGIDVEVGCYVEMEGGVEAVIPQLLAHLGQDADAAQVGLYLENPDVMGNGQYLWSVRQVETQFAATLTKTDHVPYTRVARLAKAATGGSVSVWALDIETDEHGLVTPAVVVQTHSESAQDSVRTALEADGLVVIEPTFRSGTEEDRAWHRRHKLVYTKNADRFDEDALRWVGHLSDQTGRYMNRDSFRVA